MQENPFLQSGIPPKKSQKVLNILQAFGFIAAVFLLLYFFVITPSEVDGPSMEPTLYNGQILFTNRLIQYMGQDGGIIGDYDHGDIVIFHSAALNDDIVKRVIAVPGDTVLIENNAVYINGEKLNEPYLKENETTYGGSFASEGRALVIPAGKFFVLGDNRNQSKDSRTSDIGFLDRNEIKGKAIVRVWPITAFRFL